MTYGIKVFPLELSSASTKISKTALRDLVYQRLHEMIENSRFSPGERINVEKLTAELGVSRTPVWQAVGLLEKEGLLTYNPYKGVFINKLSYQQAIDLYSVRGVLECMAAELSVHRINISALAKMRKILAKQEKVIRPPVDLVKYSKLDFDFHSEIYQASGNEFLIELLDRIKNKMRPLVNHLEEILPDLVQDHLDVYNALINHNAASARASFQRHNERMKEQITKSSEGG
jgi:DNA-binding GntR family transcriptional regulator